MKNCQLFNKVAVLFPNIWWLIWSYLIKRERNNLNSIFIVKTWRGSQTFESLCFTYCGRHCINQEKWDILSDFEALTEILGFQSQTFPPLKSINGYFSLITLFFFFLATAVKFLGRTFTGVLDVSRLEGRMEQDEIDIG